MRIQVAGMANTVVSCVKFSRKICFL